ncbi:SDR family oxidoreductase [Candidatus Nitrosocosmicus arcticus]|uniref:3-oxoacyl-[acyl-carrier-protein] reductase / short chain alcohol dehydrogenase n=1 Tax=Candidatus Nitrosocosmicus arcticus TaxID=2035267 RepID=A0A557SVV8_9ARCH|nr:SDR family oxidoreductase [Candidatus Nitrosocosmicus arcticus]TVP40740.1 3-oxoacyl-[acyl-carrier-protein] reductase / short chain alcohol dehydrogenase [Candidatus Nitrosocosmicus arcticus]
MSEQRVAVVTGSSSGIGFEISLMLARHGFITYATMRDLQKRSILKSIADKENIPLKCIQLDVTNDISTKQAIETIVKESNKIDVLVNNAGYGLSGALEDLSINEIKIQFDTNFFGLIRATQAVLPIMRKQKSGAIVNISSGLGRFGIATSSAYASSKFAIEGLTESISYELEPFGIRTILVEPGIIKTNFIKAAVLAQKSTDPNSPYFQFMNNMEDGMKKLIESGEKPEYVARVVLDAINDNNPKLRYLAGKDVEQIMEIKNKVSDEDFHNMIKKMSS